MRVLKTLLTTIAFLMTLASPVFAENTSTWKLEIFGKGIDGKIDPKNVLEVTVSKSELQTVSESSAATFDIWWFQDGADPTMHSSYISTYRSFSTGSLKVYVVGKPVTRDGANGQAFFLECSSPSGDPRLMYLGLIAFGGDRPSTRWISIAPFFGRSDEVYALHFKGNEANNLQALILGGSAAEFWARYIDEQGAADQIKGACNASPTTIASPPIN